MHSHNSERMCSSLLIVIVASWISVLNVHNEMAIKDLSFNLLPLIFSSQTTIGIALPIVPGYRTYEAATREKRGSDSKM